MWIFFAHQPAVTSPVDGRKDIDKAIGSDKERGSKEGHSGRPDWIGSIGVISLSRYISINILLYINYICILVQALSMIIPKGIHNSMVANTPTSCYYAGTE